MDGYNWYVLAYQKNNKFYAHAFRINNNSNLVSFMKDHLQAGLVIMNPCSTKKRAFEITKVWNDGWKSENKYLFSETF